MFFQAALGLKSQGSRGELRWQDNSSLEFFAFESPAGMLRLRKRTTYPATFAYVDGSVLKAGYGNVNLAKDTLVQSPLDPADKAWLSEEFFYIEIDISALTVRVQRDAFCTMPLYTLHTSEKISLANTFEDVCSPHDAATLKVSKSKLQDFFTDQKSNRLETYIEDCQTLNVLERLTWGSQGVDKSHLTIPYTPSDESDPKLFRQFFDSLLQEYAKKYLDGRPAACEFSGGIDSAIIAGYLADHGHDPLLLTAGFKDDSNAITQQGKIQDFKERFRTRHFIVSLDQDVFPLARMSTTNYWQPFSQYEEIYYEVFEAHAQQLVKDGVSTVFNGLGGDDVVASFDLPEPTKKLPDFFTNADITPPPDRAAFSNTNTLRLPWQFLDQKLACNNVYLKHGIWPVAPYTDPRFFMYCQSLKLRFRDNKNIYRMYCHAWQYPESIYHPLANEDFGIFFDTFAKHSLEELAERWITNSHLAKMGIIDLQKAMEYVANSKSNDERFQSYRLVTAEINLQTLGIRNWQ